ncbi:hypothetical protein K469DRAFT_753293 [Zopfia rhizophila CBS 207.26]|uniref:Methyltransferase domain-containing protein n=1 Tax=Zopfia rhizophila CBS 207.26 TaxID=1314779 RepID=A0A6A6DM65_9PEZI|nr:hypothetical protein K469DRAFT_753293 [Zopfia rhizophila CBS 207.26]
MAAFADKIYSHKSHAAFRPDYPPSLYDTILAFQGRRRPRKLRVDLGPGHGYLSKEFDKVIAVDLSEGMLATAKSLTLESEYANLGFRKESLENLHFIEDGAIDLVVAGILLFVDHPKAAEILRDYTLNEDRDKLGSYWPRSGASIMASMYRDIKPPDEDWEDVEWIEYIPVTNGRNSGKGTLFVGKGVKVGDYKDMVRTWCAFHHWQEAHPEALKRSAGGNGDVVDVCFDEIANIETQWKDDDFEVDVEWESILLLARRRDSSQ